MSAQTLRCQHRGSIARPFQSASLHARCKPASRTFVQAEQRQTDIVRLVDLRGVCRCQFVVRLAQNSPVGLRLSRVCRQSLSQHVVAAILALSLSASPSLAAVTGAAQGAGVSADSASSSTDSGDNTTPIYFGNGCFWGRQKDFVDVEKALGREGGKISAITGYAGGAKGAGTLLPNKPCTTCISCSVFWFLSSQGVCNVVGCASDKNCM